MMIRIGDKVKFLNDVGGGIVTRFINNKMVNVENQDGFEIPYPVTQLINVSDPALNRQEGVPVEDKEQPRPEVVPEADSMEGHFIPGKEAPDFFFCIVPKNSIHPSEGEVELFLLNDSNFTVLFRYFYFENGKYHTIGHGMLAPNTRRKVDSLVSGHLNELPGYCFQIIYFRDEETEWHPAIFKKFRINPVKFYKQKSFHQNPFFEQNAMILQITEDILDAELGKLSEDDLKEVVRLKEQQTYEKPAPRAKTDMVTEVDLHIHELLDNPAGLSNKEILDIQLEKVEREMRTAIQSRAKRIVFIHGVGQGVLKQEVAKLLKSKFPKYVFQDASFKEYGYGATMVILRKGKG